MRVSLLRKSIVRTAIAGLMIVAAPTAAMASGSGSGGSGGGSGGGSTACATVALLPLYTFGNGGNQRFVVQGNVTNCGATAAIYTMIATDVSTHTDPLCQLKPTSYRLPSVASTASQYWWQASGSGVCLTESYTMRVDVTANNTVLTSATVSWG